MKRTKYCGDFRETDVGKTATACGWVRTKRDMGRVIFIDLLDREGELQVVFNPQNTDPSTFALAEQVRAQSVIEVNGMVHLRDPETVNTRIKTGTVELRVAQATLLSTAATLPFHPEDGASVREDLRLRYRFLDLRRPEMYRNLRLRHEVAKAIRNFMDSAGFLEVETPTLTKSTPEGARDYLVPSRVHPGTFYALPQSPQIFKQLLMLGGIDRYYQIARCFRDEDLRADRQPEFTQLDLEMSFVEVEDVLELVERLFKAVIYDTTSNKLTDPFPRLSWQEAVDRYGSDKPDLRYGLPIVDLTDLAQNCDFTVFRKVCDAGGVVRAITVPGKADFTRNTINELTDYAIAQGAKGMAWVAWREDGEIYSILTKYFSTEELHAILERVKAKPGDFVLFSADTLQTVRHVSGMLRIRLADLLGLAAPDKLAFVIVTEFPMFEYSEDAKRYVAQHHPFTMPYKEDLPYLKTKPEIVRSQAYDFVLNGVELGSGSIRIHDSEIQSQVFSALGFSAEAIEERFGFMVNAFRYGAPPHGGFAFGLDRLVMLLAKESSLREVIAFPKIKDASCPLTDAPNTVDPAQLTELGLNLEQNVNSATSAVGARKAAFRSGADNFKLEHLEKLSMLQLEPAERSKLQDEISRIIEFADTISDLDTTDLPPTYSMIPNQRVYRTEPRMSSLTQAEILQNTAAAREGAFVVPRVVE